MHEWGWLRVAFLAAMPGGVVFSAAVAGIGARRIALGVLPVVSGEMAPARDFAVLR